MKTCINITDELYDYMTDVALRESLILSELREHTATLPGAIMQTSPDQAQFMALLVKLLGVNRILEIGTFTGYSALAMAEALPNGGQLITCDIDEKTTSIAKTYWERAGVAQKIQLKLGDASESLQALQQEKALFDLAFIDADKRRLQHYFESCLTLVKPGGLIMVDNVLWHGEVINPENQTPQTLAIREFNKTLNADPRVEISIMPIGDGLTLARKK